MTSQNRPLLAVDVGNTRIKLGLYHSTACGRRLAGTAKRLSSARTLLIQIGCGLGCAKQRSKVQQLANGGSPA